MIETDQYLEFAIGLSDTEKTIDALVVNFRQLANELERAKRLGFEFNTNPFAELKPFRLKRKVSGISAEEIRAQFNLSFDPQILRYHLTALKISLQIRGRLSDVCYAYQLVVLTPEHLMDGLSSSPNLSEKQVETVRRALQKVDLDLGMNLPPTLIEWASKHW